MVAIPVFSPYPGRFATHFVALVRSMGHSGERAPRQARRHYPAHRPEFAEWAAMSREMHRL